MTGSIERDRYIALDAVRGVCAVLVVLMHSSLLSGRELAPSAFVVVDLFFMMSGFVIANAYDDRLQGGAFLQSFMLRRLARLFPMWALGMAIAFVGVFPFALHNGHASRLVLDNVLNVFFLPLLDGGYLFPTNVPGWSLFYELVANLLYGMVARRLTTPVLMSVVLLSGCSIVVATLFGGTINGGDDRGTMLVGLARVGFGFFLGILIYRRPRPRILPSWGGGLFWIAITLFSLIVLLLPAHLRSATTDLFFVFLGCPAMVWLSLKVRLRSVALCENLGALSYPIYAIHFAVFMFIYFLYSYLTRWQVRHVPFGTTMAVVAITAGVALWLGRTLDPWAQKQAARLLGQRPVRIAQP